MDVHLKPCQVLKRTTSHRELEKEVNFCSWNLRAASGALAVAGVFAVPGTLVLVVDKIIRLVKACLGKEVDHEISIKGKKKIERIVEKKMFAAKKLGEAFVTLLISPIASVALIIRGLAGAIIHPIITHKEKFKS